MISKASGTNVCFSNKVNPLLLVIVIFVFVFSEFKFAQRTWQVTPHTHPELERQTPRGNMLAWHSSIHFNFTFHISHCALDALRLIFC